LDRPEGSAPAIYKLLVEQVGEKRLRNQLIAAFSESGDFNDARKRFDRLTSTISALSDDEVEQIQKVFASNTQLYDAYYLLNQNRLINFMKGCTSKEFEIKGKKLVLKNVVQNKQANDEIPF
jgi:hypothetical protein